jgi:hypothetical protein
MRVHLTILDVRDVQINIGRISRLDRHVDHHRSRRRLDYASGHNTCELVVTSK